MCEDKKRKRALWGEYLKNKNISIGRRLEKRTAFSSKRKSALKSHEITLEALTEIGHHGQTSVPFIVRGRLMIIKKQGPSCSSEDA